MNFKVITLCLILLSQASPNYHFYWLVLTFLFIGEGKKLMTKCSRCYPDRIMGFWLCCFSPWRTNQLKVSSCTCRGACVTDYQEELGLTSSDLIWYTCSSLSKGMWCDTELSCWRNVPIIGCSQITLNLVDVIKRENIPDSDHQILHFILHRLMNLYIAYLIHFSRSESVSAEQSSRDSASYMAILTNVLTRQ